MTEIEVDNRSTQTHKRGTGAPCTAFCCFGNSAGDNTPILLLSWEESLGVYCHSIRLCNTEY